MNRTLWILQILLAVLFLVAGGAKFLTPADQMTQGMPAWMSISFLHFVGVCELLGGIGLILPGLLHIKPGLTPLAAACLTIIVIGATVVTVMGGMIATALLPLVATLLSAFVAYGRWRLAPLS
ncbi:MAG: DoxX family protein [Acidobacteriia bacterium]|nr:DoxX family protein [Terriglobia bacterium]